MLISSAGLIPLPEDSVHSTLRDVEVRAEVELVMIGVGIAVIDRGRQEWNSYQGVSKRLYLALQQYQLPGYYTVYVHLLKNETQQRSREYQCQEMLMCERVYWKEGLKMTGCSH